MNSRSLRWSLLLCLASAGCKVALGTAGDGGALSVGSRKADAGIPGDGGAADAGVGADAGAPADSGTADAGVSGDAGIQGDAGAMDAGASADGGPADAGVGLDAGASLDGGASDAGTATDAGALADGGVADAGVGVDAGVDAGAAPDGGPADAGVGTDAGAPADGGGPIADAGPCLPQGNSCTSSVECCGGLACAAVGGGATGTYCEPSATGACGPNSTFCNGVCAITLTDPKNCGGCGIQCGSTEVCTSAACRPSSSCPQGRSACSSQCVDLQSSNANCGTCGSPCSPGLGCAAGSCVQTVLLADGGAVACTGAGPPILVGDAGVCAASLAQVTYRWGFCDCGAVSLGAPLYTDAFNSALGPYVDGGLGGSFGANGSFHTGDLFDIHGTTWIGGDAGLSFGSTGNQVAEDLWLNGPLGNGGDLGVAGNAFVNGDVSGANAISGQLFVPTGASVSQGTVAAGGVVRGPVAVPPPCDCAANQLVDVAGIVQYGSSHNDNASLGLSPDALNNGANRLDLPCGRYYLTTITSGSAVTIGVHGRTAIFVGGDISLGSPFSVTLDANAELDLFIGGTLAVDAPLSLGSTEVPAQTRVYIAGSATVSTGSASIVAGNFYLPWAKLGGGSAKDIYGSAFCGSFGSGAPLSIHYDSAILSSAAECPAPDGGVSCSSCRDCGNQACIGGVCGACQTRADCCTPFVCVHARCRPPG